MVQNFLFHEYKNNHENRKILEEHFPELDPSTKPTYHYTHKTPQQHIPQYPTWNVYKLPGFDGYDQELAELAQLEQEFPSIAQKRIVFFFENLSKNVDLTKQFLIMHFRSAYKPLLKSVIKKRAQSQDQLMHQSDDEDFEEMFEFDSAKVKELKKLDSQELRNRYEEIRGQVKQLKQNKHVVSNLKACSKGSKKMIYLGQYQNMQYNTEKQYEAKREESLIILYILCTRSDFATIDLHYLFVEEAKQILKIVFNEGLRRK